MEQKTTTSRRWAYLAAAILALSLPLPALAEDSALDDYKEKKSQGAADPTAAVLGGTSQNTGSSKTRNFGLSSPSSSLSSPSSTIGNTDFKTGLSGGNANNSPSSTSNMGGGMGGGIGGINLGMDADTGALGGTGITGVNGSNASSSKNLENKAAPKQPAVSDKEKGESEKKEEDPILVVSPDNAEATLVFAASSGDPAEVKAALAAGADPNKTFNTGKIPVLSLAASRDDKYTEEVIDLLLDAGADINIEDEKKQTPLFYAAAAGSMRATKHLIRKGADESHVNDKKQTARSHAFQLDKKEYVDEYDAYVTERANAVRKAYEDNHKAIEARNEELKKRNEEYEKLNEELEENYKVQNARDAAYKKKLQEMKEQKVKSDAEATINASKAKDKTEQTVTTSSKKQKRKRQELTVQDEREIAVLIHDISYHRCAEEYWKFIRQSRVDTNYSLDELKNLVDAHFTLAMTAENTMKRKYKANDKYLKKVIQPSEDQIIAQLNKPLTKAHMASDGFGTEKDVESRCGLIADQWELADR